MRALHHIHMYARTFSYPYIHTHTHQFFLIKKKYIYTVYSLYIKFIN
uniref:Uncharacterized protein n=1 Tax=Anguilla anguilla TaxID=7936 RepID=A0A0E9P9E8_ANGAN